MMLQMELRALLLAILVVVNFPTHSLAQVKYLEQGQKGFGINLSYSKTGQRNTGGIQLGYSAEGRIGVGTVFGKSDSPQAKIFGAYIEGNLLKPGKDIPIGITTLLSYARTLFSVDYRVEYRDPIYGILRVNDHRRTIYGESFILGLEAYFYLIKQPDAALIPAFQITRVFSKIVAGDSSERDKATGKAIVLDFVFGALSRNSFILSPGLTWIKSEKSYGVAISFVHRVK